jgi:hypothetical protein
VFDLLQHDIDIASGSTHYPQHPILISSPHGYTGHIDCRDFEAQRT